MSDEIRGFLHRELEKLHLSPGGLESVYRRVSTRRRRNRLAMTTLGLTLTAGLVAGGLSIALLREQRPTLDPSIMPNTSRLENVMSFAVSDEGVWALTCGSACGDGQRHGSSRVLKIDPVTQGVLEATSLESPDKLITEEGGVWVISFWSSTVTHLDPTDGHVIATIALKLPREVAPGDYAFNPVGLAAGGGAIWVVSGRDAVAKIDPSTDAVDYVVSTGDGLPSDDIAVDSGGVWVASDLAGVAQLDPQSGETLRTIPLEDGTSRLGVQEVELAGGVLWAAGNLARPSTDEVGTPGFVNTGQRAVAQVDPASGRVLGIISVPAGQLIVGDGHAWMASTRNGHAVLFLLDPRTHHARRVLTGRKGEVVKAEGQGSVWTITRSGNLKSSAAPELS